MTKQTKTLIAGVAMASMAMATPARGIMFARADAPRDPVELIQALKAQFKTSNDEVMAKIAEVVTAGENVKAETLAAAEKAVADVAALAETLVEVEQSIAAGVMSGGEAPKSLGQIIVDSDGYKAFAEGLSSGSKFRMDIQANTITGQEGSPPENSNTLVRPERKGGIVAGAFRSLRIADLLVSIPTTSNAYEFTRELAFTNNAAETAEGVLKPETDITFELQTVNIRTIAHWIKASKQILADAPAVAAYIDTRIRYGVDAREDLQLLVGDGTGQNISGMTIAANRTAFTPTSGDTALDSLNRAKYEIIGGDYAADGVIMNPADWGAIERLKTSTSEYVVGNPFGSITPMVWGLPVVLSNNMTSGSFHMADFANTYDHLNRESTSVELGFVNDDFTKNLVTLRGEKRTALATLKPAQTRFGALTL